MSDSKLLKKIQDYFCMVNGIYLSCLTKKDGVMTEVCQCNDKWKSMLRICYIMGNYYCNINRSFKRFRR